MTTPKLKRTHRDNSNQFNFDPPASAASIIELGSSFDAPPADLNPAITSTGYVSSTWSPHLTDMFDPFVPGDSSGLYQFATETDTDNVNGVTNGAAGCISGPSEPHSIFDQSRDEKLARLLQMYVERGPSPTQGCEDDWSNINTTSNSVNEPTSNAVTNLACSPDLAVDTMDATHTPKTNVSAAVSTSPATPGSASHKLLNTMSNSPIEIPKTSQFIDFHSASPPLQEKSGRVKRRSGGQALIGAEAFPKSSPVRRKTPTKQVLGSPFKMPGLPASAPAKQILGDNVLTNPLHSSTPTTSRPRLMDNISPWATHLQDHHSLTSGPMQSIANQGGCTMSANYKSPTNQAAFANEQLSGSGSILCPDLPSAEQPPAKRARTDTFGAQAILANVARDQQMRHQTYLQTIPHTIGSAGFSFVNHFNDPHVQHFKWLERDRTDPEPPPSMVARATGYEFPIPLPSGTMASVKREAEEEDEEVFVGQKRKAMHMTQGGMGMDNILDPFGPSGLGITQTGPELHDLFIPGQDQSASHMQTQERMMAQHKLQSSGQIQACGQFQGQCQPQLQMHGQAQGQSHFPQVFSNSRFPSSQQQQQQQQLQSQQAIPNIPISRQQQPLRSSPSAACAGAPGTPTPVSHRRSTISRAGQNVAASSPVPGTPRRTTQTPNSRSFQTPNNMRVQQQAYTATPSQTPPIQTPAELRLHLPTPQQPISTGSCPNTISETLAETNRRTEAELRSLGAEVVDYDPNMSWDDTEDVLIGNLFGGVGLLATVEGTFSETTAMEMSMPPMMNMSVPQGGTGNVAGLGNTLLNTAVGANNYGERVAMTSPDSSNNNNNNNNNIEAVAPGNAAANIATIANTAPMTGTAVSAAADLGSPYDWTSGFDEEKDFDPMDFGL